jgi:hypothetical protein
LQHALLALLHYMQVRYVDESAGMCEPELALSVRGVHGHAAAAMIA